ncbi:MAG: type IV pilus modification protein PilV [Gammaproteobacteria bacterium]|nr:type IV pilus modification protein PilV [Gammaproteobacteria bacterium]
MNKKKLLLAVSLKKQFGTSLIEVLIAVVVMSVGLVGLAALQTLSLKNNHSAYLRTQATFLAYDMVDRMRANVSSAQSGSYVVGIGTAPSGTTNCNTSACTASDLANFDTNEWKCALGNWDSSSTCSTTLSMTGMLPGGDGAVTQAGTIHTVSVRWNDRDGLQRTFQVSTEL